MDAAQLQQFGRMYQRYLRWIAPLARYSPQWLWALTQRTLGRALNPYRYRQKAIMAGMAQALGAAHRAAWAAWCDSHSQFVRNFTRYHLLNQETMRRQVRISDMDILAQLRTEGGLLLTYHTHHQNTLCCALGFEGCRVYAVASAPEMSPIFSYIDQWALQVNRESARHFHGGGYLFINDMRHLSRSVRKALTEKDVVVCLSDFHQPGDGCPMLPLMSRQISPPAGVIDLALRLRAPIYLALCAPESGQLVLRIRRLGIVDDRKDVLAAYIAFLEEACRQNPSCWQGWDWFSDLPTLTTLS